MPRAILLLALILGLVAGCNPQASEPSSQSPVRAGAAEECVLVDDGFGALGTVDVRAEEVVGRLEVPWGLAFLPNGDLLVTEWAGRLRLVRDALGTASLVPESVASVETGSTSEGGLLGLVLHPDFAANRLFYLYVTAGGSDGATNRVERWQLSADGTQAEREQIIFDGIAASRFHNGGRLRFGPDGMLYVGTGDARDPSISQNLQSANGKLLRLTPDGAIPDDNPIPGSPAYLSGIRNTQGWDWPDPDTAGLIWLTDHGPSGDTARRGHDEVNVARAGDNLGWPTIYSCEEQQGMITPALTWDEAAPPGGAAIYTGTAIPEWRGSLLIGTLGSQHLHRVVLNGGRVVQHEGYFSGEDGLGRLREVMMGPDGNLYVTTSNCDGRGDCPTDGDKIFRITG